MNLLPIPREPWHMSHIKIGSPTLVLITHFAAEIMFIASGVLKTVFGI
jgi:hypothetical protein